MHKKILFFCFFLCFGISLFAQEEADTTTIKQSVTLEELTVPEDTISGELPVISYSFPKKREIAGIKVTGAKNYEDFVLIGFSGLSIGDKIEYPGDAITDAMNRFWKHGLFSDVKIAATKETKDKVWLEIILTQRPIVSELTITGVKKSERKDIEERIGMAKGSQITPNLIDRAKKVIRRYYEDKGFSNVNIQIHQKDDFSNPGKVFLDIEIDKNEKTKIHHIEITGNEEVSDNALLKAMKKTNEGFNMRRNFVRSWLELFSTKKYVHEEYQKDLDNIIAKYNELGFRDARIVADTVKVFSEKKVDINILIDEGQKYHIRSINWVGNTQYASDQLEFILNMKPGDIYNQKRLNERLSSDEDAVSNIYYNRGYIFFGLDLVEVNVENDSIDLEIRIVEGPQATINRISISGNDRLYEDIVRRELRTKPGQLFSREALIRSLRELAQMGHFDPENMNPDVKPNDETGTVDIAYNLVSKGNDQIEFSAGWGQTGVIGRLSLKFTNFSIRNLFNPGTYKGIIPQGEGQTLTLSGQTNARYYQSYSISFMDPWFGGKRPNSFSISAYYMRQTDMSSRYYSGYNPYGYGGGYGGYGGYGYGGYGGYGGYDYSSTMIYDDNKYFQVLGASVGYGKRLTWPDDYFSAMAELSYQRYMMKDWNYFIIQNGDCNNLSLGLTIQRNSTDNPLYTRSGSMFVASVSATPPFSLFGNNDFSSPPEDPAERGRWLAEKNKWIEYHKWKFKGRIFMPLANPEAVKRTPVLMSRIEYGFLGHYNRNKISPFETFYMGGDGMTGYSSMYATETIGLRGYENGSLTPRSDGYAYSRMALELRYPFLLEPTSTIYGLAFVEAGNAWNTLGAFNPFELKRSAGFGVRIFLPMIGMLGIDWAYGFDKANFNSQKISGSQFHFILGQEF